MQACHVLAHRSDIGRSAQAQGPGERPPLLGEINAARVGMHRGSPARQTPGGVRDQPRTGWILDRDDTQQAGLGPLDPAAHTGALRTREAGQCRVYRTRHARR